MTTPLIDIAITAEPIDARALRGSIPEHADCGGYVSFEGHIRDINHGKKVRRLDYETYDELALKELHRIATEASERFSLSFVRAVHRKGSLEIGEPAVLIQVLSRHRREAFEGCRFVIDQLKARVPIWKKEHYDDGSTDWTRCHDHNAAAFEASAPKPDHLHHGQHP